MIKNKKGFSLVELLITMVVFLLFMTAASNVFTALLTQFKQQSKIGETNIEGIIGLEILRQDVEGAGYGLPWNVEIDGKSNIALIDGDDWEQLGNYKETSVNPYGLNDAPSSAPRGIISKNNATFSGSNSIFDGTDYLVIKSVTVAKNGTSEKWTTLSSTSPYIRIWSSAGETTPISENLQNNDTVMVISPAGRYGYLKELVTNGTSFSTKFKDVTSTEWRPPDSSVGEIDIVYGVDPANNLRMPFNRADYFILKYQGSNDIVPKRCAPNTGVLVKAVVKQNDGTFEYQPLLDCVADMQVIFGTDSDGDGFFDPTGGDSYTEDISVLNAEGIRNQLKQVRIYILAHEGQKDSTFEYPSKTVELGTDIGLGRTFNLDSKIGDPEYKYYRWKLYTIITSPKNLE
ncbi:MAG: prepilin-type N-terminal cleavage/methylation domain-containing protein [Nitrospirae bacterium]|jgi:prepilin-type N-terminal cleavage/methylation domain-containing protein|nr:prepilin-type N-terminal cleavage/methylation domain-containing protein [Nitrospirota bacterium]